MWWRRFRPGIWPPSRPGCGLSSRPKAKSLLRRHLGQLLIVDAAGLLLAGVALTLRLRLSLALVLLLGLVLILGVSRAVGFVRRE